MFGLGSRLVLSGVLGAVLVIAGPTGSAAQPAMKELAPGKVRVLGKYPKKPRKDGGKVYQYYLVDKDKPFEVRLGGPASVVLMARGVGKGGVSIGLELDEGDEKRIEMQLLPKKSRAMYLKVPEGTHQLQVKSSARVLLRPLGVEREPMAGEQVVAFEEPEKPEKPGEEGKDPDPFSLIPVGTTPAAEEKPAGETPPPVVAGEDEQAPPPPPLLSEIEPEPDTGTEATAVREEESGPYVGVGLVVDLLITSGKPSGSTGIAVPLLLTVRGYLPVGDLLFIVPGMEIGWFRLSGDGKIDLPNDPDFGTFSYSWTIDSLPIFVGVSAMLKPLVDLPLYLSAGGGFAAAYAWAESTYEKEGQPKVTDAVQSDWGIGWYLGAEAAWVLGPGRFTFEYRYSSARTDLKFRDIYSSYNREPGDLEGSNLLLGYRFDF